MDNQKLRELLEVYRPGLDNQDEQFAELIATLQRDPALQRELDERIARDQVIRQKLRTVRPPPELKARLLRDQKVIKFPQRARQLPRWCSVAAAILLVGVAAYWLNTTRQATYPMYRAEMSAYVSEHYELDTHAETLDTLRQAFAAKQWPSEYEVPPALHKLHVEGGCHRLWRGQKVSLLCFETEADGDVWLFVADRHITADAPATTTPMVFQAGKITTASWSSGKYTYLLATESPTVSIHRYF